MAARQRAGACRADLPVIISPKLTPVYKSVVIRTLTTLPGIVDVETRPPDWYFPPRRDALEVVAPVDGGRRSPVSCTRKRATRVASALSHPKSHARARDEYLPRTRVDYDTDIGFLYQSGRYSAQYTWNQMENLASDSLAIEYQDTGRSENFRPITENISVAVRSDHDRLPRLSRDSFQPTV